jgi:PAS domain S-box-containing protein
VTFSKLKGTFSSRIIMSLILLSFSILFIQQNLGRIEFHFHIFVALSFLTLYKDRQPVAYASIFILFHHLFFNELQRNEISIFDVPIVVFNYGCGLDIVLVHAVFVIFEWFVLLKVIKRQMIQYWQVKESEKAIRELNKTLEKRVEERAHELQHATEKYELFFRNSGDGIVIYGHESFVDCNDAILKMLKYSRDEFLTLKPHTISPEYQPDGKSSLEESKKIIEKTYRDGEQTFEWVHQTSDNKPVWMEITTNVITVDNEPMTYGVFRQIDTRKEYEDAIIEAKENAEEASKTKSEFLANMSHEIRTPMNGIIGMTHLALETDLNDKQRNYINKANQSAEGLLGIINDILDFSKIEAGKLEFEHIGFELKDVINSMVNIISFKAKEKHIRIKVKIDKEVPKFYIGDALRLGQVLINLGTNAVKFTKDEGSIILKVALKEDRKNDVDLQFSVEDNGIGMNEEQQSKLFLSFSQADTSTTRKYGGSGLGLAISKNICQMMGGDIWVESEEGIGSTFSFIVCLEKEDEHSYQSKKEKLSSGDELYEQLDGLKILLVEDNEVNQELAVDLLSSKGIVLGLAEDGQEAIARLEDEEYDGVLMDCQMPVMDGYEATKKLRKMEKYKELPIVALTANVMTEDIVKIKESGMDDHIAKPINPQKLYETIVKWMKKH